MSRYAEVADFEAYVEGWTTTDAAALNRLLDRATRTIDYLLGPRPAITSGTYAGLKLDPANLADWEAAALARATCAQAEYRFHVGEEDLAKDPRLASLVQGPDFQVSYGSGGERPRVGPKVAAELEPIRHLRVLTAYASP